MVHESKKTMKIFSVYIVTSFHTVKTLRLTVISPFGDIGQGGWEGGGGDKGIRRIVRTFEKILATPLLVRIAISLIQHYPSLSWEQASGILMAAARVLSE